MARVENLGVVWAFHLETPREKVWVESNIILRPHQWADNMTFEVDAATGAEVAMRMQSEGLGLAPSLGKL